jgi:HSP20 family molecular chaperone IbpA
MENIDQSVESLERLYERVTGIRLERDQVRFPLTQMNPNIDPAVVVDQRLQELLMVLGDPAVAPALRPWTPPTSVWETEDKLFVRLDLAGVRKEDLDIHVENNCLVVSGIRRMQQLAEEFRPCLLEMPFGHFVRVLPIPPSIGMQEITSNLDSGILDISIPKFAGNGVSTSATAMGNRNPKKGKGEVQ